MYLTAEHVTQIISWLEFCLPLWIGHCCKCNNVFGEILLLRWSLIVIVLSDGKHCRGSVHVTHFRLKTSTQHQFCTFLSPIHSYNYDTENWNTTNYMEVLSLLLKGISYSFNTLCVGTPTAAGRAEDKDIFIYFCISTILFIHILCFTLYWINVTKQQAHGSSTCQRWLNSVLHISKFSYCFSNAVAHSLNSHASFL